MSLETLANSPNSADQTAEAIQAIVERARSLYSLPTVALEVVRLTSHPKVDTQALKACIECDPALTAKLLRVVNSSLFGLSREVSDLNQALALLGIKPLKLLVLGFSLPDQLFTGMAREQLTWYWKTSLVRAVAARDLCRHFWHSEGDEAFLAGLLQDIGVLVLLDQLRDPYMQFLTRVIEERSTLGSREVQSLGFDHTTLSAALLRHWNLPETLVTAISTKRNEQALAGKQTRACELAQVLHLAGLLAELVGQNRLQALPELLSAGQAYCGLDKAQLYDILPPLQEKVAQLADVLSLDLEQETDYSQIVAQAHQEMAHICESVAERLSRPGDEAEWAYDQVLAETQALQAAVQECVAAPASTKEVDAATAATPSSSDAATKHDSQQKHESLGGEDPDHERDFDKQLTLAVGSCRTRRRPISVLMVSCSRTQPTDSREQRILVQVVESACRSVLDNRVKTKTLGNDTLLVLPGCDRDQTVQYADELIQTIQHSVDHLYKSVGELSCSVSIGVASVALPPKNFHPPDLITAAQRCLAAAQTSDANVVKSLEIF